MNEFLAKISFFAFNWCPQHYSFCQGELLSVGSNAALFSLLGDQFGGDGRTNFALPDLRGRVIVGQGTSNYGNTFICGQMNGSPSESLSASNLASHTHTATLNLENATTTVKVSDTDGTSKKASSRSGATLGALVTSTDKLYNGETPNVELDVDGNTVSGSVVVEPSGGGQAFSIMQPSLTLNPCIILNGIYPSRQ